MYLQIVREKIKYAHFRFIICASNDNIMVKKRKASRGSGGRKSGNEVVDQGKSKFAADEEFLDSEDEFQTGRDQVLLDERPEAKRRRRLEEQGKYIQSDFRSHRAFLTSTICRGILRAIRRRSPRIRFRIRR